MVNPLAISLARICSEGGCKIPKFAILFRAVEVRFSIIGLPKNKPSCFLSSEQ